MEPDGGITVQNQQSITPCYITPILFLSLRFFFFFTLNAGAKMLQMHEVKLAIIPT